MSCPWCSDSTAWEDVKTAAKSLMFFQPYERGRVEVSTKGPGRTRVWGADEFEMMEGAKVDALCKGKKISQVRFVVSRNMDPKTKCRTHFEQGQNHLVSGRCEGNTFYMDECGVKFYL
jgi:hypothetical protein